MRRKTSAHEKASAAVARPEAGLANQKGAFSGNANQGKYNIL
jgi:hypothetical protein